jgi:DNA invertase Pin-like site-specific DNA recombinase
MANRKFISYLRVSTQQQGGSGLGIEAQRDVVRRFLNGGSWELADEIIEVESGRKGSKSRPQLMAALSECKRQGASLIIAKLDRLARDVRFFLEVLDDSGVDIRFAEFSDINPRTDEGRMLLINMANFAEFEGRRIGSRTRAAIAAKKTRVENGTDKSGHTAWGEAWGAAGAANLRPNIEARQITANAFADKLRPMFGSMKMRGLSQRGMVEELNSIGVPAPKGGYWQLTQVQRLLARMQPVP